MTEIPEEILRRSAEARAKATGLSVEQVLAEWSGEAPAPAAEPGADAPAVTQAPSAAPAPSGFAPAASGSVQELVDRIEALEAALTQILEAEEDIEVDIGESAKELR